MTTLTNEEISKALWYLRGKATGREDIEMGKAVEVLATVCYYASEATQKLDQQAAELAAEQQQRLSSADLRALANCARTVAVVMDNDRDNTVGLLQLAERAVFAAESIDRDEAREAAGDDS